MKKLSLVAAIAAFAPVAQAENAVVGSGTPASCTATSYNAALSLVVNDVQGGVLTFNCGPNPHTININGARTLQNFVVIDGGGRITLDALDASRFFVVNQDGPDGQTLVTLQNIRLNRGNSAAEPFGGAILTNANTRLDLDNVTISNSLASVSGGAIANFGNTVLNINNSRFVGNLAANGGAIATRATVLVVGSSFSNNNASGGEGGAIQSYDAQLEVSGSQFTGNGARFGGAVFKGGSRLLLVGSNLNDNSASDDGGALYLRADGETTYVEDGGLRDNDAGRDGGAIFSGADLEVLRISMTGNSARAGGGIRMNGGNLRMNRVVLSGNNAILEGGAASLLITEDVLGAYLEYVTTHNNTVTAGSGGDFAFSFNAIGGTPQAYIGNSTLMGGSASTQGSTLQMTGVATLEIEGSLIWQRAGTACNIVAPAVVNSLGGNIGQLGCSLNAGSDAISSTFAGFGLAEFANYGGNRSSFLPLPGSPVLDRNGTFCASTDSRGRPSPVDGDANGSVLCDAGAVERQLIEVPGALFRNGFQD